MNSLSDRHCEPCEGGIDPLRPERIQTLLPQVQEWQLGDDERAIGRRFSFSGFDKVIGFINAMAWLSNQQGHHPDFRAGFNYCDVVFTTHAINGLSENDFICAARLNKLYRATAKDSVND